MIFNLSDLDKAHVFISNLPKDISLKQKDPIFIVDHALFVTDLNNYDLGVYPNHKT